MMCAEGVQAVVVAEPWTWFAEVWNDVWNGRVRAGFARRVRARTRERVKTSGKRVRCAMRRARRELDLVWSGLRGGLVGKTTS